jgi:hypothetical protein
MLGGLKHALQRREIRWLLLIFFVGLGLVNPVPTWIEDILRPRGLSTTQAGIAFATRSGSRCWRRLFLLSSC